MIHQLIFAQPKPGMSEQEFQQYWINVHAIKYASKIPQIKRYLIDAVIPDPSQREKPIFSGVAEIWLENEKEQLESLQSKEFLEGARLDEPNWAAFWNTLVLDTNTTIFLEGPSLTHNPTWVKIIRLFKRKLGMTLKDFRNYHEGPHASLVKTIPHLQRYIQCQVRDSFYVVGEARFDSVEMLWFKDLQVIDQIKNSDAYKRAEADLSQFVDPKYIFSMVASEHWIIGPEKRD